MGLIGKHPRPPAPKAAWCVTVLTPAHAMNSEKRTWAAGKARPEADLI